MESIVPNLSRREKLASLQTSRVIIVPPRTTPAAMQLQVQGATLYPEVSESGRASFPPHWLTPSRLFKLRRETYLCDSAG